MQLQQQKKSPGKWVAKKPILPSADSNSTKQENQESTNKTTTEEKNMSIEQPQSTTPAPVSNTGMPPSEPQSPPIDVIITIKAQSVEDKEVTKKETSPLPQPPATQIVKKNINPEPPTPPVAAHNTRIPQSQEPQSPATTVFIKFTTSQDIENKSIEKKDVTNDKTSPSLTQDPPTPIVEKNISTEQQTPAAGTNTGIPTSGPLSPPNPIIITQKTDADAKEDKSPKKEIPKEIKKSTSPLTPTLIAQATKPKRAPTYASSEDSLPKSSRINVDTLTRPPLFDDVDDHDPRMGRNTQSPDPHTTRRRKDGEEEYPGRPPRRAQRSSGKTDHSLTKTSTTTTWTSFLFPTQQPVEQTRLIHKGRIRSSTDTTIQKTSSCLPSCLNKRDVGLFFTIVLGGIGGAFAVGELLNLKNPIEAVNGINHAIRQNPQFAAPVLVIYALLLVAAFATWRSGIHEEQNVAPVSETKSATTRS